LTSRKGIRNKQRKDLSQECGKNYLNKARDQYLCGITNHFILEHALDGGERSPSDPTIHEGNRFTNMDGVPLFRVLSLEFEKMVQWAWP
jgi:hypothetical protein